MRSGSREGDGRWACRRRLRLPIAPRRGDAMEAGLGDQTLRRRTPGRGLPHFHHHDLRHFMARKMLAAGVPIPTVSQRLSHARTSTILNVYAHSVPGGDRNAAETLAAIFVRGGASPGTRAASRRP
jgi:integrase